MSGLRYQLKSATAEAHARLEAALDVDRHCQTHDAYRSLLIRYWGFHKSLEAALSRLDCRGSDPGLAVPHCAAWLEQDLRCLGLSEEAIAKLPRSEVLPLLDDIARGTGAPGRFFAGEDAGGCWRHFVDRLEAYAGDPAVVDRVQAAAVETSACFQAWVTDPCRETIGMS